MKLLAKIIPVMIVCFGAAAAMAGTISDGLKTIIGDMQDSDPIKVLVVMKDQVDVATLDRQLHAQKAILPLRHQTVVGSLQETAGRSQTALLSELQAEKSLGSIEGWTSHWLINAIVVKGSVGAIKQLALRDDVDVIEPDLVVDLIEPVARQQKSRDKTSRGIGITEGVQAVQADRVWNELGVNGSGAIVGCMDTGVDGAHPALSARWRGNSAPASECWLDIASFGDPTPADHHYHGTHVMGTITGLAPDDTIGVAPGALWIASNAINQSTGTEFDNDVIASLEWFADPDGNPVTFGEVPDVVQNSWGVNENFTGYFDCDSRWWTAIDNCEAAGVVLTWSAGNEGSGAMTMRSPADRAASPTNCFSVGSTIRTPPYTISDFSSRGPSGCGGAFEVKPEVCAPGSYIYSAQPGGGYQYLDGTSMAGPHVAGVVALMRSANPNVDVITIKEVLMATATDLGVPGEDNTYGHGFVNAYDAVLAVMGGIGQVEGHVTDAGTGLPLEGALVRDVGGYNSQLTDATGYYILTLTAEDHTLEYSFFGYDADSQVVTVIEDATVTADMALDRSPSGVMDGGRFNIDAQFIEGATISAVGTPLAPVTTDVDGYYQIDLPVGLTYTMKASAPGYGAAQHSVDFPATPRVNFELPPLYIEDFETGDFSAYSWQSSGNAPWTIVSVDSYEGTYCARSGSITDNQESLLEITLNVTSDSEISFWYKVSSETSYDYLRFAIDGGERESWSGEAGWALATYPVTTGIRTLTWRYTKDGSVSSGSDAGWIDLITWPTLGELPVANIDLPFSNLTYATLPGVVKTQTKTMSNSGDADLDYRITFEPSGSVRAPVARQDIPSLDLPKGAADPRVGLAPDKGQGGPDLFGYTWIDSDEPGGPTYSWLEINTLGIALGHDDDASYGPFDLGFTFSYYGVDYDQVRICTNGFVSFTSSTTDYTNDPIPASTEPNALLALFWDDMDPGSGGTIYYYEDASNNQFIVEYDGVEHYPSGNPETFQVVLRSDGSMLFQYRSLSSVTGCTVGIEDHAGTDGLQVVFDAAYLHDAMAILLQAIPPVPWVSITPDQGSIEPGSDILLPITYDTTELGLGTYYCNMFIASNDPDQPTVIVPVTLNVIEDMTGLGDSPTTPEFALLGARPNPFNPATDIQFSLPRQASVELQVYDIAGRLVRTLLAEVRSAGLNTVRWNGKDSFGHDVASGTYYARLRYEGRQQVSSLVLVR